MSVSQQESEKHAVASSSVMMHASPLFGTLLIVGLIACQQGPSDSAGLKSQKEESSVSSIQGIVHWTQGDKASKGEYRV
jgi:hypothetical protein